MIATSSVKTASAMSADPAVSVVIPSWNARHTIRRCLQSVCEQDLGTAYEVIVVDSSMDGTVGQICREFPTVTLLHLTRRTSAGEARNLGVEKAAGEFVAFTDADCIVSRDWLSRLLRRHQEGEYAAVGGSIVNGTPRSLVGSAEHLFEFNEYLPQARERLVTNIPTANICYRRSVVARHRFDGGADAYYQAEDMIFNWRLTRQGAALLFDPAIRVMHLNRTRLGPVLQHQHLLGRSSCWARKQSDLPGRLLADYPVVGPLLPLVRLARIWMRLAQCDAVEAGRFLILLPLLFLMASA